MAAPARPTEKNLWEIWHSPDQPFRLGVSSCLLGENVRYDGGHAHDRFVKDVLGKWFDFVPVCPEVEIGMGTPRPTIRLVNEGQGTRLIAPKTEEDFTDRMTTYSVDKVAQLQALELDGYILKRGSPSCGMERIRSYRGGMPVSKSDSGLFAAKLLELWPSLPVEEEGRLNDPVLCENFIERVCCRNRWRALVACGLTRHSLMVFHTAHKLLIRAHNEAGYQRLGQLIGRAGQLPDAQLFREYETDFQTTLRTKATPKKHVNVMQHAMGYFKSLLSPTEKSEINAAIEDYRQGLLPLVVPLTLLRYNIRQHGIDYLRGQIYFDPHPKELMLRNHV